MERVDARVIFNWIALPRWQIGSRFHIELLRCLAHSDDPRVYTYLHFIRNSFPPLFSIQRQRLRKETDLLMSSLRVPNE